MAQKYKKDDLSYDKSQIFVCEEYGCELPKNMAGKGEYLRCSDDTKPDNTKHIGIEAWRHFSLCFLGTKSIMIVKVYKDGTIHPYHKQDEKHFDLDKTRASPDSHPTATVS